MGESLFICNQLRRGGCLASRKKTCFLVRGKCLKIKSDWIFTSSPRAYLEFINLNPEIGKPSGASVSDTLGYYPIDSRARCQKRKIESDPLS